MQIAMTTPHGGGSLPLRFAWSALALAALIAGCATGPPRGDGRDGPGANPPADLAQVPDAEPRIEPIRAGGPNKPYQLLGRSYTPLTEDAAYPERGLASWYGRKFHGRRTANGEVYDMYAMTAAHPTLPLPSYARVRNPANGREVIVRVNDRGPFHPGRIVDLSYTAALRLDLLRAVAPVELERLTFDEIRSGAWRRGRGAEPVPVAPADPPSAQPLPQQPSSPPATPEPAPVVASEQPAGAPRADTVPAPGFWVQIGAFRVRDGAESFRARVGAEVEWLAPVLAVVDDDDATLYRLQAGPYPDRDEALGAADRIRAALHLVPLIVERR